MDPTRVRTYNLYDHDCNTPVPVADLYADPSLVTNRMGVHLGSLDYTTWLILYIPDA